ncbi:MAG: hypothetical protein FWC39_02165 [Bacteroidetes bacterium]|nr:hypothetical protein [Bacteroidota bacterium]
MKKILIIVSTLAIIVSSCTQKQNIPADAQMIAHFELNKTLFEELRSMIENDTLRSFPLTYHDKKEGKVLHISQERELEYDTVMKKIQVAEFWAFSPFSPFRENSILFFHSGKGDATWSIDKGFEYVFDRTKEEGKKFTEMELYDAVFEKWVNQCEYYKKINDNWNLFIFYDR